MTKKTKHHYYLVSGSVTFRNPADESIGSFPFNTVVQNDIQAVPIRLLGKAQQALQMNFFKKTEDPSLEVVDVHLFSFSYLGWMSEQYFHDTKHSTDPMLGAGAPQAAA